MCVLNFEIQFPQKNVFRGFLSSGNLIVEWSGAGLQLAKFDSFQRGRTNQPAQLAGFFFPGYFFGDGATTRDGRNLVPRVFVPYCACWLDETSDSRKFRLRSDFDWFSENNACHQNQPRTSAAKWWKNQQQPRQGNKWHLSTVFIVSAGAVTTIFLRRTIPLTFTGLRPQKNRCFLSLLERLTG